MKASILMLINSLLVLFESTACGKPKPRIGCRNPLLRTSGVEVAHMRCQDQHRDCGSVKIGVVRYRNLEHVVQANSILYFTSPRVNKKNEKSMTAGVTTRRNPRASSRIINRLKKRGQKYSSRLSIFFGGILPSRDCTSWGSSWLPLFYY
jgi:hypothetical protein